MTTLRAKILSTITSALKEGRREEANILRFLMAQVKNREIELRKREEGLNDEEMLEVIVREVKKHKDSIAEFQKGARDDLVKKESAELEILEQYMPAQMGEDEIKEEVKKAIQESGASKLKDLGKVMNALMPRIKGKADGAMVSKLVKEALA